MNRLTIIGNLTNDPELRTTPSGDTVCSFGVAVNRRGRRDAQGNPQEQTDFFRVSAWRQQGENCAKYLSKGRKVAVVGPVTARAYQANDGTLRASMEINATDVEFLSSRNDELGGGYAAPAVPAPAAEPQAAGFTAVETDELPF
ncbi:MAG: single-stranded DNA-binding protein [Clostridia bacterium]|jgi:single-strand DNA-binding protein|nr:single-stranded DNA-binding protein [Clostridia bacterium]